MSPEEVLQRHLLMIDSQQQQQQQQQVPVTPSPAAARGGGGGGEAATPSSVAEGTPEDGTRPREKRKLSVREIVSASWICNICTYFGLLAYLRDWWGHKMMKLCSYAGY